MFQYQFIFCSNIAIYCSGTLLSYKEIIFETSKEVEIKSKIQSVSKNFLKSGPKIESKENHHRLKEPKGTNEKLLKKKINREAPVELSNVAYFRNMVCLLLLKQISVNFKASFH